MFKKNKLRGNLSVSYSIMDSNNDGKLIDNSYIQSNLLNDDIIFFSTSHDKKFKIWKSNNNSLI